MSITIGNMTYQRLFEPGPSPDESYFNQLRKKEYERLEKSGQVYLDYTGAGLYPASLPGRHWEFLNASVFGNPHSSNPSSELSTRLVEQTRKKVLDYFNAQDYSCVFTANASAGIQLVGESYPFNRESHLLLTSDNHNSINGLREYSRSNRGPFSYCPLNAEDLTINETLLHEQLNGHSDCSNKLFAFPAQSNASGVKHPLSLVRLAQEKGWNVLLDATAFVCTSKLDLSVVQPDFVPVSFYKLFGYPTGVGCLLIKKSTFSKLRKPGFSGGTVSLVGIGYSGHFLADDHRRFENGTVNFLGIPAVRFGLEFIERIGIERINRRVSRLCAFLQSELKKLTHASGRPLVTIFGPREPEKRGAALMLNVIDKNGVLFPPGLVEQLANEELICLRTGCFCNPGVDEANNGISPEELAAFFFGRVSGDYDDMIEFIGRVRGAVRVSVGIPTSQADLERFIAFIKKFTNKSACAENRPKINEYAPGKPKTEIE